MAKTPTLEDIIASKSANQENKPGIMEALLATVDGIFTNNRRLQKSRLSHRNIRGVVRVIGGQSDLRADFAAYEGKPFVPFLDADSGEFTHSEYDNPILTAICEGVLSGRISLDGKSRDEIIRIFQAVGGAAREEEVKRNGILSRFDY